MFDVQYHFCNHRHLFFHNFTKNIAAAKIYTSYVMNYHDNTRRGKLLLDSIIRKWVIYTNPSHDKYIILTRYNSSTNESLFLVIYRENDVQENDMNYSDSGIPCKHITDEARMMHNTTSSYNFHLIQDLVACIIKRSSQRSQRPGCSCTLFSHRHIKLIF